MATIDKVHAREVLDSRGNPTVEVVLTSGAMITRAMVPSGASTGEHEAVELRDKDEKRYLGKGVLQAVANVNNDLAKLVVGMDLADLEAIDKAMIEADGTPNKGRLGANAILGISMAALKMQAKQANKGLFEIINPNSNLLPTPMMNVINGGKHADSGLNIQEFMIVPSGFDRFSEALRAGAEIFHTLKKILVSKQLATSVGDEGGFAPKLQDNTEALDLIVQAISEAGYKPGQDVFIALDAAASEFHDEMSGYQLTIKGENHTLNTNELVDYYSQMIERYPIVSIEDSHDENDWAGFTAMNAKHGEKIQLVGDDLFVTNTDFIQKGIDKSAANSVLIKVNQIGTITETKAAINMAKQAGWTSVVSHRSGETEDTTIADIAVGMETGQIKTGSLSRTDRIAKYNQLLRIEELLGDKARYQGAIR